LKFLRREIRKFGVRVTPLAGVWIEIGLVTAMTPAIGVTPLAGVWIEIRSGRSGGQH